MKIEKVVRSVARGSVIKTVFVLLCLLVVNVATYAQFNISKTPLKGIEVADSIMPRLGVMPKPIKNEFFNKARWRADRRAIRRENNTWELSATLQVAQTQFENWASGGDNTFSGRSSIFFKYQYSKAKFSLETKVEAKYGLSYIEKESYKNEDEFKINVVSGWQMHDYWSYAASASLRSQFATGHKSRSDRTRRSTFMAPGYLDLSLGLKYSRNSIFSMILSPIGGNAVFMLDNELSAQGLNGVSKGKRSKWSVGPSVRMDLDFKFAKERLRLRSNLYSFCNMQKPPTVRWETTLDIVATKFLSTTISSLIYYDKEADTPRFNSIQYKYSISVGLAYTFKNK